MKRYVTGPAGRSVDPEPIREHLEAEITSALAWISGGHAAGPDLALQAREAVREVLARNGVHGARIQANVERGRVVIDLTLPPSPARVREVRLRIG